MTNTDILRKISTQIQREYPYLTFKIDGDKLLSEYKNGIFLLTDVSTDKTYGVTSQYRIFCTKEIDEDKILNCLNELNSLYNIVGRLTKFSVPQEDVFGYVSFAPMYIPVSKECVDLESVQIYFNRLKIFLEILENDEYFKTLNNLIN